MVLVFTDLDGTLLDHETYVFEPALPALERLAVRGVPLIFCTSKTRAETEYWRARTGNRWPFVVENGGAVYVPPGSFPFPVPGAVRRGEYEVLEFGTPYSQLVEALRQAEQRSGCRVRPFHRLSAEQIAVITGLPPPQAELAAQREYDEPFEILDPQLAEQLLREIESQGFRWTRGGRFYHITGNNDKAAALRALTALYRRLEPALVTIALGDGLNDAAMLAAADQAFVMPSAQSSRLLEMVPGARLAPQPGPVGWARAILEMVPE
ncbi:MAG: HAD-IIB family hydrolase [Bryobacteraceae bacterium]|nr:HAD-IIB family hydrolase [Bryobacteraceae bacterium]